jgi:hypothetical protein
MMFVPLIVPKGTSELVHEYFDELWYMGPNGIEMTALDYFEDVVLYARHLNRQGMHEGFVFEVVSRLN